MQKVFINNDTDRVEQILQVAEGEEIQDDYFPNCYVVDDIEETINAYNLRYNKELKIFEVIEGLPERDKVIIIKKIDTEEIENIRNENEELKARLERLEELLIK